MAVAPPPPPALSSAQVPWRWACWRAATPGGHVTASPWQRVVYQRGRCEAAGGGAQCRAASPVPPATSALLLLLQVRRAVAAMDADLDELLEEVESKFLRHDAPARRPGKERVHKAPSFGDDGLPPLDEILRDMGDAAPPAALEAAPAAAPAAARAPAPCPAKCFPLYVSGADVSCGLSTVASPRACSHLHCTACDFGVQVFEGLRWRDDTDYLFLRTHMPHFYRLRERLRVAAGWRAYACQCRHFSTRQLQQLQRVPDLPWVCRGHAPS